MSFLFYLRLLARESRAARGRFAFFVACISVGVAVVVGVAAIGSAKARQARQAPATWFQQLVHVARSHSGHIRMSSPARPS